MKMIHMYTGSDRRSHFVDLELELADGPGGASLELLTAIQGVAIREVAPGWASGLHAAPRRQLVVQLAGTGEVTVGDGSQRVLNPGELLLADDIVGEGHISREIKGPRRQLAVYLDPALDLGSIAQGVR
jgi:hypothetical protein